MNSEDCEPNNPEKQDKPNKLMMERINKLPIWIGSKKELMGDTFQVSHIKNRDKGETRQYRQTKNDFYSTIKKYPNLLSSIEEVKNPEVNLINRKIKKVGYLRGSAQLYFKTNEDNSIKDRRTEITVGVGKDKETNAIILFHELGHAKDYDKLNIITEEEKQQPFIEEEESAEMYKLKKLVELHRREYEKPLTKKTQDYVQFRKKIMDNPQYIKSEEHKQYIDKSKKEVDVLMKQAKEEQTFNMEQNKQKGMQMFGYEDNDGDTVPNAFDCEPNNPNKQDKPNKLMMERINKLPIYIATKRTTLEGVYDNSLKSGRITNKIKVGRQFKQTRNDFYSTVKRYPNIISDIEQTPIQDIILINDLMKKKSVRGMTILQKGSIGNERNQNFIVMNVGKYKGENAGVLFHELGHAKEYGKIKTQADYDEHRKNESIIDSERNAEEHKTKKFIEVYGKEMEPSLKESEKRYIKKTEEELKGVDESFYTQSNPEEVASIKKQILLAKQGEKEREVNIEQNKQKGMQMFGYQDNDGDTVPNAFDCEPNNSEKQDEDIWKNYTEKKEKYEKELKEKVDKIKSTDHKQAAYEALRISAEDFRKTRGDVNLQDTLAARHELKEKITKTPIAIDLTRNKPIIFNEDEAEDMINALDKEVDNMLIRYDAEELLAHKLYGKSLFNLTDSEKNHIKYVIRQNVR
jgi:hypothetical protein